jgi:hypothetical protein
LAALNPGPYGFLSTSSLESATGFFETLNDFPLPVELKREQLSQCTMVEARAT